MTSPELWNFIFDSSVKSIGYNTTQSNLYQRKAVVRTVGDSEYWFSGGNEKIGCHLAKLKRKVFQYA